MPFVRGHRRSRTQSEIDPLTACGVTLSQPPSSHSLSKDVVAVACSSHNFDSFRTFPSIPNKTPSFRNTISVPAVSVSLKVIPSLATIPEPRLEIDSKAAAVANVTKLSEVVLDESSSDSTKSLKGKDMLHDEKLRLFRFPSSISFTSTKVETTSSGNVISLSQSTSTISSTLSSIIFPTSSIKATNLANSSNSEKLSKGGDVNLSAEFSSDHGTTLVRDVARLTEELLSRDQEENDGNDVNALSPGESPQQQPPNIAAEKGDQSILKNNDSLSIHESSLVNDHGNKLIVSDNLITKLEIMVPEASFLTSSSSPNSVNYSKINNDETADTATSLSKLLNLTAEKTKAKTKELSAVIRQEKKQGILLMVEKSLKRRLSNAGGGGTCLDDGALTKNAQLVRQEEFKKSHSCSTPVSCKFPPPSYGFGLSNNYWAAARSPSIIA